jgi:Ca-activated chloride channel homolog
MAALKCPSVLHFVSTFMTVLLCPIALAQSTARTPQSLVKLNVLVTDKSDRPVMDLNQEDFLVFDEGKQQALSFFQKEDIPISYGLIVDNTGSMRSTRDYVIQVAKAIVSSNRPEDQTLILRLIDGKALLAADWTSDKTALLNSLSIMNNASGLGPLIDSIYACSEEIAKHLNAEDIANRRRAIILLTDGIERESSKKMDELLSRLHKENIQVFAIGFVFFKDTRKQAVKFLKTLTEETGGRSLYLETREKMKASAELIASYLRSQYVIGYSPSQDAKNNSLRKVRVKIIDGPNRDKYSITCRLRYSLLSN